jgi:uncharacterized protein
MTQVGIAYSGYVPQLLATVPWSIDYLEVPVELLLHDATAVQALGGKPVILHCASLNIAGSAPPDPGVVDAIKRWVRSTATPWLGEHLAFISAERRWAEAGADEYAPGQPYNLGFTVSPPMNEASVRRVAAAVDRYAAELATPLLLENSPLYFRMPGTTMTQAAFVREICRRSPVGLLLDLTHFQITARNMGLDAAAELLEYPLDRVEEIHVSGTSEEEGIHWDDHARPADQQVYDLLRIALDRAPARAITLEYNWSARFPADVLGEEIERTRRLIAHG